MWASWHPANKSCKISCKCTKFILMIQILHHMASQKNHKVAFKCWQRTPCRTWCNFSDFGGKILRQCEPLISESRQLITITWKTLSTWELTSPLLIKENWRTLKLNWTLSLNQLAIRSRVSNKIWLKNPGARVHCLSKQVKRYNKRLKIMRCSHKNLWALSIFSKASQET